MTVVQKTGAGSNPRIRNGYYGHRTLGLTPAGTICRSNLSLSYYPIQGFRATPLIRLPSGNGKSGLIGGITSLEG